MTTVLIFVVGVAITAGVVWLMMRMERRHRQLIERRREVWRGERRDGAGPLVSLRRKRRRRHQLRRRLTQT